jgi:glucosamine--fructose-6-phosphate aminotransferase (isomerizing)
MCGIIGYIGSKPVVPVLLDGLRRMEYRGYDSAGVALVSADGITLRRAAGKLANLESTIREEPLDGLYGVGHTRWATHGRPTEENAHPHRDCTGRIVVVHNGIIENYLDLKRELQAQGHKFTTETDTEIVAHLVEREMKTTAWRTPSAALCCRCAACSRSCSCPRTIRKRLSPVRNGPPDRRRAGRQRVFRCVRYSGDSEPHPRRRLSRRRGDGGDHPHWRAVHRLLGA